jgi:hypothetical protein
MNLKRHNCPTDKRRLAYDGRGIPLCYVCDECRQAKLARYEPVVQRSYTQEDVDERIEED